MSGVSAAALAAALLFISFHVPGLPTSSGKPAQLVGVTYHLLLLPAVATLAAPEWARTAGYAWMLLDAVLDGAAFAGLPAHIGDALRQGVHVLAAVWVVAAGWTGGVGLAVAGTLLAGAFVARFLLTGFGIPSGRWLRNLNAVLNVAWMIAVAAVLWT